jgi:hypothetical protein
MKLVEVSNSKLPQFKGEATSIKELIASIKNGRFTLDGRKLRIPGNLSLDRLGLTSLVGCPQYVEGSFSCRENKLETLEGGPQEVGNDYICTKNRLKTLAGAPEKVNGEFNCSVNKLPNLENCPKIVKGNFYCAKNKLTSFVGCPEIINGEFHAYNNLELISLEGAPKCVRDSVFLEDCDKLTSFKDIHLYFPEVRHTFTLDIKKDMLGLFKIRGLKYIITFNDELDDILNKYLKSRDIVGCAVKLIEAGYEEQARV